MENWRGSFLIKNPYWNKSVRWMKMKIVFAGSVRLKEKEKINFVSYWEVVENWNQAGVSNSNASQLSQKNEMYILAM